MGQTVAIEAILQCLGLDCRQKYTNQRPHLVLLRSQQSMGLLANLQPMVNIYGKRNRKTKSKISLTNLSIESNTIDDDDDDDFGRASRFC